MIRLYAVDNDGKLKITNELPKNNIKMIKDYEYEDNKFIAVRKGNKYAIFDRDEYLMMFGDQYINFDDTSYFSTID